MIGSFGNVAFLATADRVRTFRNLTKQAEARYAEHALAGRKPVLEFIGPGLETVSFSVRLDPFLGIDPLGEITALTRLRDRGEANPLVIGGEFIGLFVLTDLSEDRRNHDNKGRLLLADVTLSLKETGDE